MSGSEFELFFSFLSLCVKSLLGAKRVLLGPGIDRGAVTSATARKPGSEPCEGPVLTAIRSKQIIIKIM